MEMDQELFDAFIEEVTTLKKELVTIQNKISSSTSSPEDYPAFAQIIDRIFGTATTMGLTEVGEYLGVIRNTCRKCGNSNIERAKPEVFKLISSCMNNFDLLIKSVSDPKSLEIFLENTKLDIKRSEKLDKEIFVYSKEATSILK